MEISIKIQNINELRAAFLRAPAVATREFGKAINRSANRIATDAKRNAPVNKQSGGGTLRQSIKNRMTGKATAVIESRAKYSAYVDQGTRPHIIRVKQAKVLYSSKIKRAFGRVVNHPGTRAQPYFTNAIKSGEPYMNDQLKTAMQNTLNSIR